ncbi:DUF6960 family protein [Pseudobacteroides cellulosolvens]|uniref:Uncharacterized protein n=1 Tax=Pseudobacteroides cellulosolvens ATCC 35603 = DSM 2933 TaxID=398512 RepID=A0A0L6JKG3_9FIRM|nr:hypothetical protein [Pseudobacteroides cellulosolvens]KNY25872.1 hypothetical protein Bccel_1132 [Pseudobacteroides cellulosolvens ATCC 35603 = DSM 2933]
MNDLTGTWGVYPWFYEDGEDLIHPLDLCRFKERFLYSGGKVFFCKDIVEKYLVLKYKDELFRVKPDLYNRVKMPTFDYGDYLKLKDRPEAICVVNDIVWHFKEDAPKY